LLANAALLAQADGEASSKETALLAKLSGILGFDAEEARAIIESAGDGALNLSSRSLEADE
jgi:hypothetical protein